MLPLLKKKQSTTQVLLLSRLIGSMLCNQSALFVITALNKQIIDPQWAGSTPSDILLLRGTKTPPLVPGRLDQTYRRHPGSIHIEDKRGDD